MKLTWRQDGDPGDWVAHWNGITVRLGPIGYGSSIETETAILGAAEFREFLYAVLDKQEQILEQNGQL